MNSVINLAAVSLFALQPLFGFAKDNQCAPRKNELIKYTCPSYSKNINNSSPSTIQDGWTPDKDEFKLSSSNHLSYLGVSTGDDIAPWKEGVLRGSGGTTKLNSGYMVYLPSTRNGKWTLGTETYYLQCRYKNTDVVLYKKINKEMRTCDVHFKKTKSQSTKTIPTGVAICSASDQYIDKNAESRDCRIGQSANQ
jgi:hypothetical protein